LASTVTLTAGGDTITISAPAATLFQPGSGNLDAGGATITITAPAATLIPAADLAAGQAAILISAPAATLVVQSDQNLAAGGNTITITAPLASIAGPSDEGGGAGGRWNFQWHKEKAPEEPEDLLLCAGPQTIWITAPEVTLLLGPSRAVVRNDDDETIALAVLFLLTEDQSG
jgi:hypothetical protein